ncbi:Fe2+-enterobactin ABC transporter substrate-binding protein [Schumannella luteola]|uniref:Iron complex transport system substrate-binding protein n=1 Tax=Schumannella luteola TaxID=472059 RepID=A0A852Y7Q9_9MICO|nr:Fe2+-enterobactin ABC transporter substrate-binding protein [Schumannella luteola]NYG98986.1 iron complex transport system substrate-binding protein [Schumannella luteola]TPX06351.1 Fe2+-enterobactin ABC transporter substrate-binding protein [Schumannella luteola]
MTHARPRLRTALVALAAAAALVLTGCAADSADAGDSADSGSWPRTIEHENGSTEIPAKPQNIVSTSITLTGTLLAIDAPVTATATTTPSEITDDDGYFAQWADVAKKRDVAELYPDLTFDEEAVIAAAPDLIVVSASGADSTAEQYDQLSAIAPTIVLDYGSHTWQELAEQLGEATGHEAEAKKTVADFDAKVAKVAADITVPAGTANAIVWNGTENDTAFAKPEGSHGKLLTALGFDIRGADDSLDTSTQTRKDFAFVSIENAVGALTGETVFLISGGDAKVDDLKSVPVMANAPAVASGSLHPLGDTSFRIDYYSGLQIVDAVEKQFG